VGHLERDDVFDEKQKANHPYNHDGQTNVTEAEWPNKAVHACNFENARSFHFEINTGPPDRPPNQLRLRTAPRQPGVRGGTKTHQEDHMRKTAIVLASATALAAVAAPAPAEARGGYVPTYYGSYAPAYDAPTYYYLSPYGGYTPATYYDGYPPGWSGYHYRRVVQPAFAYDGGPGFWHHRWHREWHRQW
jgi:hypothetical protein